MIVAAMILTLIGGVFACALGFSMNMPELGTIVSIVIMGAFIMLEVRRTGQKTNEDDPGDKKD